MTTRKKTLYSIGQTTECEKPTYYFNAAGNEVSYIEHAAYIAAHSRAERNPAGELAYWIYPMLEREDRKTYWAIILRITHYERKPIDSQHLDRRQYS